MKLTCLFPIPDGVTYDGSWPDVHPPFHQFTDAAVTGSTIGVYERDFTAEGVRREIEKTRAKFTEAACADESAHGCGLAPHLCGCALCALELTEARA